MTTVSPVISGLTCVCLGFLFLAFGFCYFLLVLLYRNKKKKQTHFKKISEVCKDEVSELLMNGHAGNANLPVFIKRFGIDPF